MMDKGMKGGGLPPPLSLPPALSPERAAGPSEGAGRHSALTAASSDSATNLLFNE